MNGAPIFARGIDGAWLVDPIAQGPFEGMQGGAAAALMCAAIEAQAAAERMGLVASVTTHFLSAVPLAPLNVTTELLKRGRSVSMVDARLTSGGKLLAVQRVTLICPKSQPALPVPPAGSANPERLEPQSRAAAHGRPWMMDAMDARSGDDGMAWFRLKRPIVVPAGAMASILPAADWAHGISPPLGAALRPPVAIPNPDLTVHLFRRPLGAWIGLEHASAWSRDGIGTGWAALHDAEGLVGRVAMSVAVTLLE
jgi:hypothetical protein